MSRGDSQSLTNPGVHSVDFAGMSLLASNSSSRLKTPTLGIEIGVAIEHRNSKTDSNCDTDTEKNFTAG